MKRDAGAIVVDMLTAIEGIELAVARLDLQGFSADWVRRHAVQRGIEIISEASRRIPEEILARHPSIPWTKIKAVGNILRHEYHQIADEVIWNIVRDSLPPLKAALTEILATYRDQP